MELRESAAMVDCIVKAHIDNNDLQSAESVCVEALDIPLKGSLTWMWNSLIVAYAMRRDLDNANRILQRMSVANVKHNELTYAALMQALAMVKLPDQAFKIMTQVLPKAGFRPNSVHFAIIMGAYLGTGQIPRVFRMHRYLLKRALPQTASTNALLLRAHMNRDAFMLAQGTATQKYQRAMEMFLGMIYDKQDRTNVEKGMGSMPLEDAYAASINSFVIAMLARAGETDTALQIYTRFMSNCSGFGKGQSPNSDDDSTALHQISTTRSSRRPGMLGHDYG